MPKEGVRQVNEKGRKYRDCIKRNRDKIWTRTMCYDVPAYHTRIPNVKGWCLINCGLNPYIVVQYTGSQCDGFVK